MIVLSEYRAPTETLRRTDALDGAGAVHIDRMVGMSADPWGIGLAAITLPDCETCETCHDTGEVGDGYTREYDTGAWVTWPCPDCTYPTRTPA